MSAIEFLKAPLGLNDSNEQYSGLNVLKNRLAERESSLSLDATFMEPTINTTGAPSALFPYTTTYDDEYYSGAVKEFVLPDNGTLADDSPLVQFLSRALDVDAENVERSDIDALEGVEATATLTDGGEYELDFNNGADDGGSDE